MLVPEPERTGLIFPCAAGDAGPHGVVLWARAAGPARVRMQYGTDPALATSRETRKQVPAADRDFTVQWELTGLEPGTPYFYRAWVTGKEPGPICRFMTAPPPDEAAHVRFAVGADMGQKYQPFSILNRIRENDPEFLLLLGDTVYADTGFRFARTVPEFHRRHAANRKDAALQALLASTSVYATWDDHEVMDNYEGSFVLAPLGQKAFFHYWPIRSAAGEPGRLYRSIRWGSGVEIFLLDTRQYRSSPDRTMLGRAQKNWLLAGLHSSSAAFKFIATSVPFTNPGHDQWGGFPAERDEILQFIVAHRIKGVVFLSGDLHYAAVVPVPGGEGIKEIITGPLAQMTRFPRDVEGLEFWYGGEVNYLMVEVGYRGAEPRLAISIVNKDNHIVHRFVR